MKTYDNFSSSATRLASFATIAFSLCAFLFIYLNGVVFQSWPIVAFYILLLINCFYSIRVFATITPNNITQKIIDLILVMSILAMPRFFNDPIIFTLLNLFMFIIASLKYILIVQLTGLSKLLHRKIFIDTMGILLCFIVVVGIFFQLEYLFSIFLFVVFLLANIYLFFHKPLYVVEDHKEFSLTIKI